MPGHYGKKMKKPMAKKAKGKKGKKKKIMPKKKGKKYTAKQMKIARVAFPRDKITRADFAKLRQGRKKKWLNYVLEVKRQRSVNLKFTRLPMPNMYAAGICSGRIKPKAKKRKR